MFKTRNYRVPWINIRKYNLGKCYYAGCQMVYPAPLLYWYFNRSLHKWKGRVRIYFILFLFEPRVESKILRICVRCLRYCKKRQYLQTHNVEQCLIVMCRNIINLDSIRMATIMLCGILEQAEHTIKCKPWQCITPRIRKLNAHRSPHLR